VVHTAAAVRIAVGLVRTVVVVRLVAGSLVVVAPDAVAADAAARSAAESAAADAAGAAGSFAGGASGFLLVGGAGEGAPAWPPAAAAGSARRVAGIGRHCAGTAGCRALRLGLSE